MKTCRRHSEFRPLVGWCDECDFDRNREIAAEAIAKFHELMAQRVPGYFNGASAYTVAIEAMTLTLMPHIAAMIARVK